MGKRRGVCRVLVGKPKKKVPLGRPRSRWEDNIKMDLPKVRWGVGWIDPAHNTDGWRALSIAVMNL
jgi:hypothetical protein